MLLITRDLAEDDMLGPFSCPIWTFLCLADIATPLPPLFLIARVIMGRAAWVLVLGGAATVSTW